MTMLCLYPIEPLSDLARASLAWRYGGEINDRGTIVPHVELPWFDVRVSPVDVMLRATFQRSCDHDAPAMESAEVFFPDLADTIAAAVELRQRMSDISEDGICASWESGLEDSLWHYVESDDAAHPFAGLMGHDDGDRAELRRLRDACGMWWVYDHRGNRPVSVEVFRAAFNEHGRWPEPFDKWEDGSDGVKNRGWCPGLVWRAQCPCAACSQQRLTALP